MGGAKRLRNWQNVFHDRVHVAPKITVIQDGDREVFRA